MLDIHKFQHFVWLNMAEVTILFFSNNSTIANLYLFLKQAMNPSCVLPWSVDCRPSKITYRWAWSRNSSPIPFSYPCQALASTPPAPPTSLALSISDGVHDTLRSGGVDWRSREEGWAVGTYSGAIHHMLSPPPHKLVKNYQSLLEIILINFLGPAQTWSI